MAEVLRNWILGLAGAAILTSVALMVTPEGKVKRVVSLVCGLAVIIMLIKPVAGFDYAAYSKGYMSLKRDGEFFSDGLSDTNEKLTGLIIEEACSAYILDKGAGLGIVGLKAAVSAKWSEDGYWYPGSARLEADADKELQDKLGYIIQADLGIPPEELIWSMDHEG